MRHPDPLTLAQHLSLTAAKIANIQKALSTWMGLDKETLWAANFSSSLVSVLGELLEPDSSGMKDFLSARSPRHIRPLRARQVQYVALHWLADLALSRDDGRLD